MATQINKLPQRLRAKQVAELYGIGLSTVWFYARKKIITPIKISDSVTVFSTEELERVFSTSSKELEWIAVETSTLNLIIEKRYQRN